MWNKSHGSDAGQASFAIRIVERIASVDPKVWNGLATIGGGPFGSAQSQPDNPFVTHEFLSALEDSGCVGQRAGWLPQHLVLEGEDGVPIAVAPAYLKSHSQGEYVFDYGWADAFQRAGGRYYPKLQMSVPFTPATGPRLLVGGLPGAEVRRQALAEGAKA